MLSAFSCRVGLCGEHLAVAVSVHHYCTSFINAISIAVQVSFLASPAAMRLSTGEAAGTGVFLVSALPQTKLIGQENPSPCRRTGLYGMEGPKWNRDVAQTELFAIDQVLGINFLSRTRSERFSLSNASSIFRSDIASPISVM